MIYSGDWGYILPLDTDRDLHAPDLEKVQLKLTRPDGSTVDVEYLPAALAQMPQYQLQYRPANGHITLPGRYLVQVRFLGAASAYALTTSRGYFEVASSPWTP